MTEIENKVLTFLNEPLPVDVLNAIMDTIEAYGEFKATINNENIELLEKLLLTRELQLAYALVGEDLSIEDILLGIYFHKDNEIINQVVAYEKCKEYMIEKVSRYKIIPASDFLRINCCLKTCNTKALSEKHILEVYDNFAQSLNDEVFKAFYALNNQQNIFLRMTVAYYLLNVKFTDFSFDALALDILFSTFVKRENTVTLPPIWLAKYYLLQEDWEYDALDIPFERAIIRFLLYLKREFNCMSIMVQNKKNMFTNLAELLQQNFPKAYPERIFKLLSESFCFRNNSIIETLHVTPMTAIKYCKLLEENKLILSVKIGREKIYLNQILISLIIGMI